MGLPDLLFSFDRWVIMGVARLFARKAPLAPPLSARPASEFRHLARALAYHEVTLVLDINAGPGAFGHALRQAGYRGHIVSFEAESFAHRRLSEAAAGDADWTVAPRLKVSDIDEDGVLPLMDPADEATPTRPMARLALTMAREEGAEGEQDGPLVGEVPTDHRRLDTLLHQYAPGHPRLMVAIAGAGEEEAVMRGIGAAAGHEVGLWQLDLAFWRPDAPDLKGYAGAIAEMANRGYDPILFSPGYFSNHSARMTEFTALFARHDWLTRGPVLLGSAHEAAPPAGSHPHGGPEDPLHPITEPDEGAEED
ncbi:hypothetical protein [Radicibacter daui]|uniref:hypothetical protein n=1 Tax=Radicibacter daui TaxID=3064829 RepID=UPI004046D7DD